VKQIRGLAPWNRRVPNCPPPPHKACFTWNSALKPSREAIDSPPPLVSIPAWIVDRGTARTVVSRGTESSVQSPIVTPFVTPCAKIYVPRETDSEAVPHGLYLVTEKPGNLELVGLSFHVERSLRFRVRLSLPLSLLCVTIDVPRETGL